MPTSSLRWCHSQFLMKQSQKAYDLLWENYSILQEVSNFGYNQAKKNKQTDRIHTYTHDTRTHKARGDSSVIFQNYRLLTNSFPHNYNIMFE